jgi:translation initiation factor 3 subunit I
MIITSSSDQSAKLWDAKTLTCLKTFSTDRPVNSSCISPIYNQIILGGGQEAMDVTTTSSKAGKFECDFFHSIYETFLGSVKGHFGPINTLAFSPDGKHYASGAEDGYIRLHHLPSHYL